MTGADNLKFVDGHTNDISKGTGEPSLVGPTTLNATIQKASGDNKSKFSLAIMHSAVATNLENLNLLTYLKYTDANGIQRDLTIGTWNGRTVLIDDGMPTEEVAESSSGAGDSYLDFELYKNYISENLLHVIGLQEVETLKANIDSKFNIYDLNKIVYGKSST